MRLTEQEILAIKNIVYRYDRQAKIYLFGSRVNDSLRGGDIDLLVVSDKLTRRELRSIKINLYDEIGEQKIDLLLAKDTNKHFVNNALEEGVLL